ncbi:hypothetical protein [Cognatilysobacter bugurensis]|uniref:Uncharacterized protein n=1 Tax=Cognatilysobacter bugurensis TaxID=543356 RepID=A0A918SVG9_9GAMM|nr:hypothetical protein [Lysobacter bugurensis]GHA72851.1 hypothetical protein GCM10007067_06820 [Lysobacter bugurensis]
MSLPTRRSLAAAGALVAVLFAIPVSAEPIERLSFVSEPGDPVGLGQQMTLSPLYERGGESSMSISGRGTDGDYWLSIQAPADGRLEPGVYENAHGGDVEYDPSRPRLEFQHESQRCAVVSGRYEITELKFEQSGYVERFRATFEQRCAGSDATLWGQVDIVKPALDPITTMDIRILPVVELVRSTWRQGYEDALARFVAVCNNATGGDFDATLVQRGPGGTVTRSIVGDRMGCTPGGSHQIAIFQTAGFRPGRAMLKIHAFVEDPVLGDQAAFVSKVVTQEVILRPSRPERRTRSMNRPAR